MLLILFKCIRKCNKKCFIIPILESDTRSINSIVNIIRSKYKREQLFNNYRNNRLFFFSFESLGIMSIKRLNYCLPPIFIWYHQQTMSTKLIVAEKGDYRWFVRDNSVEISVAHPKVTLSFWPFWDYPNDLSSLFHLF